MRAFDSSSWYLSTRKIEGRLDMIHIGSIAFYLIFPLIVVLGHFFQIEALLKVEQELMYAGSLALGLWLVFDFFWPALPVSRAYIILHHGIAALVVGLALLFQLYFPLAIGILLQEGYTFLFRKVLYAPTLELMADLARFTVSGMLLAVYVHEVHWSMAVLWMFFIANNAYFFKSTHQKVFVSES